MDKSNPFFGYDSKENLLQGIMDMVFNCIESEQRKPALFKPETERRLGELSDKLREVLDLPPEVPLTYEEHVKQLIAERLQHAKPPGQA